MKNLSRGILNNKTEVKFLQAWLNQFCKEELSVDGSFGTKTEAALIRYQVKCGFRATGKADQQTLNRMGFKTTRNKNLVVLEIPFNLITKANVLLENGKAYSCQKFAKEKGFDIVWNGAHFNTANRKVVQLVMKAGVTVQWGMGYTGIAYPNNWAVSPRAICTDVYDNTGKPYDLQGGAPRLIHNYIRDTDSISKFDRNLYNAKTRRNCTGLTENSILLFFSLTPMSFEDVVAEGLYQKVETLCGNDCGGSQSLYMGGAYVITTDGRAIPAAVGLKVTAR